MPGAHHTNQQSSRRGNEAHFSARHLCAFALQLAARTSLYKMGLFGTGTGTHSHTFRTNSQTISGPVPFCAWLKMRTLERRGQAREIPIPRGSADVRFRHHPKRDKMRRFPIFKKLSHCGRGTYEDASGACPILNSSVFFRGYSFPRTVSDFRKSRNSGSRLSTLDSRPLTAGRKMLQQTGPERVLSVWAHGR